MMRLLRLLCITLGAYDVVRGIDNGAPATLPSSRGLLKPKSQITQSARSAADIPLKASDTSNEPGARNLWTPGFDLTNDTDQVYPQTGIVREYTFTITNTTCNPDGHGPVQCMLINGQLPGPTINADWGDTVRIHVHNQLQSNGTSLHFHGVRQLNSNSQDGVGGITECPLAPGKERTYEWHATQYGTSWYHSHHTVQYGEGIFGPIVIHGPSAADYDTDVGPVVMNEWFYVPSYEASVVEEVFSVEKKIGFPPENYLFNGKAKDAQGNGEYEVFAVESQKKHKLRLINASTESAMRFAIDSHSLLVIAADFVPIQPFVTDSIMVGIGQRYDVVVEANQSSGAYWVRAGIESACGGLSKRSGYAVLKYADQESSVPPGGEDLEPLPVNDCIVPADIKPIWPSSIGTRDDYVSRAQSLFFTADFSPPNGSIIIWKFNQTGMDIEWEKPTLTYIAEHNSSYSPTAAVIELPSTQEWAYWIVQSVGSDVSFLAHPIHLHGHDFYVLGKGNGTFDAATAQLNLEDPPRRDSDYIYGDHMTQQGTWMAIAFKTGNPGAWLLHCHVSSHIGAGFGVQYIDSKDKIAAPDQDYYDGCRDWKDYYANATYKKTDSGM